MYYFRSSGNSVPSINIKSLRNLEKKDVFKIERKVFRLTEGTIQVRDRLKKNNTKIWRLHYKIQKLQM